MSMIKNTFGVNWEVVGMLVAFLSVPIHCWTVVVAWSLSGFFAAFIAFNLPMLSTAYWFFKVAASTCLGSPYCIAIMAYLGLCGTAALCFLVFNREEESLDDSICMADAEEMDMLESSASD